MKKYLITLLLLLILLLTGTSASAKWNVHESVNLHGHMGTLEMELETLDIDLAGEALYPGWSKDITFIVTNTGDISFVLDVREQDVPDFLTIVVEVPVGEIAPGATAKVTLHCTIDSAITDSMGADAAFAVKLTAQQP